MKDDTISKKDAVSAISDLLMLELKGERLPTYNEVYRAIYDLPSAQPDIVACGDCIHWICHDRRCGYWNHGVKPLDWCCHAERRTDG